MNLNTFDVYNVTDTGEKIVFGGGYRAIAYVPVPVDGVWRWIGSDGDLPVSRVDTNYVTHINFAGAHIKVHQFDWKTLECPIMNNRAVGHEAYKDPADGKYHYKAVVDGAWIDGIDKPVNGGKYLRALVDLKKEKPSIKVTLMVGGWNSDGWCYMARTPKGRAEFIQSLVDLINEYGIDGIDIDWEYPSNGGGGEIAWCENCENDAREFLIETRAEFDKAFPDEHKILSIDVGCNTWKIPTELFDRLDYVNVMCYDYDPTEPYIDQSPMDWCKQSMNQMATSVGDTPQNRSKINMGIPFYNGAGLVAAAYYDEWEQTVTTSPEITRGKMQWVKDHGYGGGFYWNYTLDFFEGDKSNGGKNSKELQRMLYETLNNE